MPLFRGFAITEEQVGFQGFAVDTPEVHFQGFAIEDEEIEVVPFLAAGAPNPQSCNSYVVNGPLVVSGNGEEVALAVFDETETPAMVLRHESGSDPQLADLQIGGGQDNLALLEVRDKKCRTAICLNGQESTLIAGCEFRDGEVRVKNNQNETKILLSGSEGQMEAGGTGDGGKLAVLAKEESPEAPDAENSPFYMDGNTGVLALNGGQLHGGRAWLRKQGEETILVDWEMGTVEIQNGDFAEEFTVSEQSEAHFGPGTVVVLDEEGNILPCSEANDKRAIGIVSGAGTLKPGIVMDRKAGAKNRKPVALAGKVFCQVEALDNPVKVGDSLTTSQVRGFACKAGSLQQAQGAVIGKALRGLEKGKSGLIPVKVGLR